jgi:integrase
MKGLVPPATGNKITWDDEIAGFGARITAGKAKAFVFNYRARGIERRLTIGPYPEWSVAAARERAKELRRDIDLGDDPLEAKREERAMPTMRELSERYISEWLPRKRPSGAKRDRQIIANDILPALGKIRVADITTAHVAALHQKVTKRGPIKANRVLALCSKMLNLAALWSYRSGDNPCKFVERNREVPRERLLTPDELGRLVTALKTKRTSSSRALLMALLTGARGGEVRHMTWGQIDMAAGTWTKPAAGTKQRRMHVTPLSVAALALLAEIRPQAPEEDAYVFANRITPGQPLTDVRKAWINACKEARVENSVPHDLRHGFASTLVAGGASLFLVSKLLGHSSQAMAARYSHLQLDPLREGVERVAAVVEAAAAGRQATVVPLAPGKSKR